MVDKISLDQSFSFQQASIFPLTFSSSLLFYFGSVCAHVNFTGNLGSAHSVLASGWANCHVCFCQFQCWLQSLSSFNGNKLYYDKLCIFLLDFIFCFWLTVQRVPENWLYLRVWSLGIVGGFWTDYEVQVNNGVKSSCIFKRCPKLKWLMLSRFPNSVKFSHFCSYCSPTQPKQLQQVFKV